MCRKGLFCSETERPLLHLSKKVSFPGEQKSLLSGKAERSPLQWKGQAFSPLKRKGLLQGEQKVNLSRGAEKSTLQSSGEVPSFHFLQWSGKVSFPVEQKSRLSSRAENSPIQKVGKFSSPVGAEGSLFQWDGKVSSPSCWRGLK